jgi:hypothetical protein
MSSRFNPAAAAGLPGSTASPPADDFGEVDLLTDGFWTRHVGRAETAWGRGAAGPTGRPVVCEAVA